MLRSSEPEQNNPEQLEEPKQIHVSCDKTDITWKDGSGRAQSIDNIPFKVDIDTLISKTIFRLSCRVWIKGKGKNRAQLKGRKSQAGDKQSVYLFIHPENIQNIKLGDDDDVPSLHFSMNQGHSRLVIPSDCILGCKKSVHARLHSMRALAETGDFTIHFRNDQINAPPLTANRISILGYQHQSSRNR